MKIVPLRKLASINDFTHISKRCPPTHKCLNFVCCAERLFKFYKNKRIIINSAHRLPQTNKKMFYRARRAFPCNFRISLLGISLLITLHSLQNEICFMYIWWAVVFLMYFVSMNSKIEVRFSVWILFLFTINFFFFLVFFFHFNLSRVRNFRIGGQFIAFDN